ncbi:amidohydrolase family protein [Bradyrhizobium sp. ARR65]|uniref:amidohydrolase family protein n=1 Tax=Bradyrhizobium sp. ARR65 TaxID=1040989 RepID=UPI0004656A7C|nr:amidohydrolase family protein [Bradyrhizobium sp. ARR65]
MTRSERLLIAGGLVVDPQSGTADRKDILIEGGRIAQIGAPGTLNATHAARHDGRDRLVLPGLVNAHTHGHANLVKGVAEAWTLEASLTNGPWLAGARDPETMYLSTLLGALDMLSKGCTACFDLVYEFPRPTKDGFLAVARAYADAGMRAVLAPMIADQSLFQSIPGLPDALPQDLREAVRNFDLASGETIVAAVETILAAQGELPGGVSVGIAPTIPHHCSERFLRACMDVAARHRLSVHMHIAESRLQAVVARKVYGRSAVRHLAGLGMLRPGFTAAHGVWLDDEDLDLLAAHGCSVAHIPASNYRLGSGIAHVRPMLERGINVGLATDGANSSDSLSMLQAMRLASFGARSFAGSRTGWLTSRELVRLATLGGAKILGLEGCGRLEQGACADLVLFDLAHIDFIPDTDPVNQLVTSADSASVTDVVVGGVFKVRDRKLVSVDTSDLRDRVRESVKALAASTRSARVLAERLEPHVVAFAESISSEPLSIERRIVPRQG